MYGGGYALPLSNHFAAAGTGTPLLVPKPGMVPVPKRVPEGYLDFEPLEKPLELYVDLYVQPQ